VSTTPFVGTDAVRAGSLTERELRRSCTRIYRDVYQRRGSNLTARGMKQLRRVLPLIDAGAESPQESRTRLVLIRGGLPRPQTQIVVRNMWGAVVARIDMGWEEWLVGVEYDGPQHWTDPRIRANDIERTAELERRGWRLVRVGADLLRHRPDVIVDRARSALLAAGCPLVTTLVTARL